MLAAPDRQGDIGWWLLLSHEHAGDLLHSATPLRALCLRGLDLERRIPFVNRHGLRPLSEEDYCSGIFGRLDLSPGVNGLQ